MGEPFYDHNSISFTLTISPFKFRPSQKLVYSYKKADWNNLRNFLRHTPWQCSFMQENDNWIAWKDLLLAAVAECIPTSKARRKPDVPWISKELKTLCRRKKSLHKKAKRRNREQDWNNYRKINNLLKKKCNAAKWDHLKNLTEDLKENYNTKPFLSYIKSKRKGTKDLVSLKVDNTTITDDGNIANSMNAYFSSVFTSEDYGNFPDMDYVTRTNLTKVHCSTKEVQKHLRDFNMYKFPGPDGIPPRILKECAMELSPSLTILLNKSLTTG